MKEYSSDDKYSFLDHADAIIQDELIINKDDLSGMEEAQDNLWYIHLGSEQLKNLSVEVLCGFLLEVLDQRETQLRMQCGLSYPMLFYCWVDELAGQLRFSIVRDSPAGLPFKCSLRRVSHLEKIVEQYLASPYLDGISWEEIDLNTDDSFWDESVTIPTILDVWVQQIPRNSAV